jgi:hypothetical protein
MSPFALSLQQIGDEPGPTRLMAGAQPRAVVAMKILVEMEVIAPLWIALNFHPLAKDRPLSSVTAQENTHEPTR